MISPSVVSYLSTQVSPQSVRSLPKLGSIQALSGIVFAFFLILHLVTAMSGLFGIPSYD